MPYYTTPTPNSIPIPQLSSSVRSVSPGEEDGVERPSYLYSHHQDDGLYYTYHGNVAGNNMPDPPEWEQPYPKPRQRRSDESRFDYHQDTQFPMEEDSQFYATAAYPGDEERPSYSSPPIMVPKRTGAGSGSGAPRITVSEYGYEAGAINSHKHIYPPQVQTHHHTSREQRDRGHSRPIRGSGSNEYRHETHSEYSQCPSPSGLRFSTAVSYDSTSYTTRYSTSPTSPTFSEMSTPPREMNTYGRVPLWYEEREAFTRYSR